MTEAVRQNVRLAVRDVFAHDPQAEPTDEENDVTAIRQAMAKLGFHKAHIQEALQHRSSRTGVLDWLCFYVPEGDLPKALCPESVEFVATQHDQASLARHYLANSMVKYGFSHKDCVSALAHASDCDVGALRWLVAHLCGEPLQETSPVESLAEVMEMQEEEMMALGVIFEEGTMFRLVVDEDDTKRFVLAMDVQQAQQCQEETRAANTPSDGTH